MGDRTAPSLILLCSVLVVALVVGAFAHGYARVRDADPALGVQAVVICADGGARTILVDQDGAPVDPASCLRELCNACLTPQFLATGDAPLLPSRILAGQSIAFLPAVAVEPILRPVFSAHPRAPPFPA
ncbi:hypothetical protein A8B78_18330 [Jannaschia sp. EhC01]|nr:hypothetical protein A8B78_18330 [Jannaschia sp. EhC01]